MKKILKHSSGTIEFSKSGNAFLISDSKAVKKDIFIPKSKTGKALNGDSVFIKLIPKKDSPDEYVGEVAGIVKRFRTEFVGVLEQSQDGKFIVLKTISKRMPVEFIIPTENMATATIGDKVLIKLSRWHKAENKPVGVVKQVFGKAGEHSTEMNSILFENNIDSTFPENVLAEAEAIPFEIPAEEILKREDFRGVMTICIDPSTAKDKDDSISFKRIDKNVVEIGVHIADITYYVEPKSMLFKEAYKRGNSVYLVDRVINLFPKRLSSDICSLNPNQDKLCFSAVFKINKDGDVISEWFGRTVININKDYSYEDAQEVIKGGVRENSKEEDLTILELDKYAKTIRKKRVDSSILFNKKEIKFKLDDDNYPIGVYFKEQRDANFLIEEFMLLANKYVAKHLISKNTPSVNRVHNKPDIERLTELKRFVSTFGYDIHIEGDIKKEINKLLFDIKGKSEENIISTLVIRTQQKAIYSATETGHFGLGFSEYCHFTSCIRRMSDVLTHLQLATALGNNGYPIKKVV